MLAPMEGVTNSYFREMVVELGAVDVVATEFVRLSQERQNIAPITRHSVPLQIQLMGVTPEIIGSCLIFLKEKGRIHDDDWIDLNVGCPSKKVNSKGAGAALLLEPKKLVKIVETMREHHSGPLSIKTRVGYQTDENYIDILEALSDCPIDFIAIHARTRCAGYSEPVNLEYLSQATSKLPFDVIGNGDVWTAKDGITMLNETGVAGIMCGRGAIANPYLFNDIREFKAEKPPLSLEYQRIRLLTFAVKLLETYQADTSKKNFIGTSKEFCMWLSKNPALGKPFFQAVKLCRNVPEILEVLQSLHKDALKAGQSELDSEFSFASQNTF